ncbi:MAG: hypothetical protein JO011_04740 [Ktedonobacteraceae bacterium]|nr:hypothetical protein [Ktedonobacteraceae bacterium]
MSSRYSASNRQFPNNVSQAAASYQLGALVASFGPKFTNPFAIIGMVK